MAPDSGFLFTAELDFTQSKLKDKVGYDYFDKVIGCYYDEESEEE